MNDDAMKGGGVGDDNGPIGAGLAAREVSMGELDRRASKVVAEVIGGQVAVVSRHGRPVAMILSLHDAVGLLPPSVVMGGGLGELAARFERRDAEREWSRLLHGRWWNGGGIHGRYGR